MRRRERRRPTSLDVLVGVILFLGITAMFAGLALLSGAFVPPTSWLSGSPFPSYVVPGIVLFALLGAVPVVVAAGLFRGREWGWPGALAVGSLLSIWLAVRALFVGWGTAIHWFYLGVGVAIALLAVVPSVRRYGGPRRSNGTT